MAREKMYNKSEEESPVRSKISGSHLEDSRELMTEQEFR